MQSGHADMVHDAQLDYYGRRLATCSSDKTIKIFEIVGEQHTHIADLKGHEGPVWQVCWAHPKYGSLLASCSFDHRIIVWKETQDNQWQQVIWDGELVLVLGVPVERSTPGFSQQLSCVSKLFHCRFTSLPGHYIQHLSTALHGLPMSWASSLQQPPQTGQSLSLNTLPAQASGKAPR